MKRGIIQLAIILVLLPATVSGQLRNWTDSTGKFQLTAEFVQIADGMVIFRREDGSKINVPAKRISKIDVAYLRSFMGIVDKFSPAVQRLERATEKQKTAKDCQELYENYLVGKDVSDIERAEVQGRLDYWKTLVAQKVVRFGDEWLSIEEAEAQEENGERLYREALRFIEIGNSDEAAKKLREASRANPESVKADFLLGLGYALISREPEKAERHFAEVVRRKMRDHPFLSPREQLNLTAALNNVALTEIRQRNFSRALARFRTAVEQGLMGAELIHNMGKFSQLGNTYTFLNTDSRSMESAGGLYVASTSDESMPKFAPNRGWLYMFNVAEAPLSQRLSEIATARPIPVASRDGETDHLLWTSCGSGFVVADNHIVTNRHVVERYDQIRIKKHDDTLANASVVAVSENRDLALLKCEALDVRPISFQIEPPRKGQDLAVLGFPLGFEEMLGSDLKITKGILSGLENPSHDEMLIYDAITNGGNSGGPVCNRRGQVLAVHAAGMNFVPETKPMAFGVSARHAIKFLESHVTLPPSGTVASDLPSWSDVVDSIGPSVVQIRIYELASSMDTAKKWRGDKIAMDRLGEDIWCMACNGTNRMPCPALECKRGKELFFRTVQIGFDQLLKKPIYGKKVAYRPCRVCSARGAVDCRFCTDGVDPSVR